MRLLLLALVTTSLLLLGCAPPDGPVEPIKVGAEDWPWWRGPTRNGVAAANQKPPLKWSSSKNILWKTPVPGRGHGSATVVGDQVFLASADAGSEEQSVLCYDRRTGKQRWQTVVHRGGFEKKKGNSKSSLASSTVACDGQRLFINFLHDGAVYTTALDRDGKKLWQTKISSYVLHQGYGSSPCVFGPLVIVSADNKGGGAIAGLNRATGKIVWKRDRPKTPNYASPIVLRADDRDQLLFTGCDHVTSLDPLTGKELWEIEGSTTECVTSIVTDGQLVFSSGGYPKNHVAAVRADGSGKIAWEYKTRVYVPSMVVRDGYLYAVQDGGIALCWKCDTGKEVWRGRLRGTFSSSPVLVGDHLYATNEAGQTFILEATPRRFHLIGENALEAEVMSTPAICGSRIYLRGAVQENERRQEMLYCIGTEE